MNQSNARASALNSQEQKPAQTARKAMSIEARELKAGDVIVWLRNDKVSRDNVQEVRAGWWCRVYALANGGRDVLTLREADRLCIERGPLFHVEVVNNKTGMRVRMTGYPMTEDQCQTMMAKITAYPWRSLELVEVAA